MNNAAVSVEGRVVTGSAKDTSLDRFWQQQDRETDAQVRAEIERALPQEYERNLLSLNVAGLLEFIPELGALGIRDSDGNICPIPTVEQIKAMIEQKWSLVKEKWQQGFTHLQLTPMALSLPKFVRATEQQLQTHAQQGNLFVSHPGLRIMPTPARLHKDYAVFNAIDKERLGAMRYFPRFFSTENETGMEKTEMVRQLRRSKFPGWSVCLMEDFTKLPPLAERSFVHQRMSLPVGLRADQYIQTLHGRNYIGETPLTWEDLLTHFLLDLEMSNQISPDLQSTMSLCLGGAVSFPSRLEMLTANWESDAGVLSLRRYGSGMSFSNSVCRTAVRLNEISAPTSVDDDDVENS